jgi:DNA topoisomerase I
MSITYMGSLDIHVLASYWLKKQFPMDGNDNSIIGGGNKKRWDTLSHNGVLFPPTYIKHNVPIIYDGSHIELSPEAEEIATQYARYLESEYIQNKVFNKNFWKDFKKYVANTEIKDFDKCNFELIKQHILKTKESNLLISKAEKERIKAERELVEAPYKTAIVDGILEPVDSFKVEPPGIFLGRGCHPKLGRIKPRLYPSDFIINIGKGVEIKNPIIDGKEMKWKKVIHDKNVVWLASWIDPISKKTKYVWLGSKSSIKAESDMNKFDLARKLKKKIKGIRKENDSKILNGNDKEKQVATALYFIDNLALRVGNEKGSDEADTVGVTSLRVEHIKLGPDLSVTLDFLGKDSVRYVKKIKVTQGVYDNLTQFSLNKSPDTDLFNLINSADLNKYLQGYMKNLTAKVFRTYNASYLFQKELRNASKKYSEIDDINKINFMYDEYNKANAKVALLCNHQKKVTESFNVQLEKLSVMVKELKVKLKSETDDKKKDKIKKRIKSLNSKRIVKTELKGVSLGTSKTNYIDPRITVAFMKKHGVPVDKLFSKALQDKFKWAFNIDDSYKF